MTSTPPPTTLSTPSPTERSAFSQRPEHNLPADRDIPSTSELQEMNTFKAKKPIYLVVATAVKPHGGIGNKGTLPWPSIKSDMAFFRKATTGDRSDPDAKLNAVIMGRKTYESIPTRFRPLSDRVNVILTRGDVRGFADKVLHELTRSSGDPKESDAVGKQEPAFEYRIVDRATVDGLAKQVVSIVKRDHSQPTVMVTKWLDRAVDVDAENVFCVGGAEIYGLVLRDQGLKERDVRVLQTLVRRVGAEGGVDGNEDSEGFECDTFWPVEMDAEDGWCQVETDAVEGWAGVKVPQGSGEGWKKDEKAGVETRVIGWEREGRVIGC